MKRGTIRRRAERAIAGAEWIERAGSDAIAVGMVYTLADAVDGLRMANLEGRLSPEAAGKAAFTAQVLLRYLSEMGLTPASRGAFTADHEPGTDLVATLTAIAGGASTR